jgi:pilus assembly protein Flp/PilA
LKGGCQQLISAGLFFRNTLSDLRREKMLQKMKDLYATMVCYATSEEGQALVEYALLLVLIALVVIVMLTGVGSNVNKTFSTINNSLK